MKKDPKGAVKGPKKYFPAWFFGPHYTGPDAAGREDQANARIFQKQEDVPLGWYRSPQEAKDNAAAATAAAVKELPPAAVPAPNRGRGRTVAKPVDERAAKIAELVKAGYDPKELEKASDAELDSALKDLKDGAHN